MRLSPTGGFLSVVNFHSRREREKNLNVPELPGYSPLRDPSRRRRADGQLCSFVNVEYIVSRSYLFHARVIERSFAERDTQRRILFPVLIELDLASNF